MRVKNVWLRYPDLTVTSIRDTEIILVPVAKYKKAFKKHTPSTKKINSRLN